VVATELALLLGRLERLNEAFVADICRRHDLSSSELRVLAMLRHGRGRPVSPTTIGRWVVQTSGGLTATLKRLERRQYIERLPDPDDGRGRLVALTDQGASSYDAALDDLRGRYESVLADIDTEEALPLVRELVDAFERSANLESRAVWALDENGTTARSTL
jgi:DNA-binding MarR family transcriptional regulator